MPRHAVGGATKVGTAADAGGHAGLSWQDVSWLMLSDIIGTAVLTLTGVARELGWLLTVVFIVGLFPVSLYVSVLMTRTRQLVLRTAALRMVSENEVPVTTMGEIAGSVFQHPSAGRAVEFAVYGYTFLGQASYLLVLGTTIQQVFYDISVCLYTAVALGCLVVAVPFCLLRELRDSVLMCLLNTMLIAAVVVLSLILLAWKSTEDERGLEAVNAELTFSKALGAGTKVVYSFAGQWMYFELMETMATPSDFPRAFFVSGPFMVVTYLTVALLGSFLGATHGDLVADVPKSIWLRAIAVMLFLHVAVVYLIKGVVVARFLLKVFSPSDLNLRTAASYLRHGGWAVSMLLSGWVLANVIPFFSQFLGLLGGLFAGPINFLLPVALFLVARGDNLMWEGKGTSEMELSPPSGLGSSLRATAEELTGKESPSVVLCSKRRWASALRTLPGWERAFIGFTAVFIGLTMVFGVHSEIRQIVRLSNETGAPFTCHALEHRSLANATIRADFFGL